MYIFGLLIIFFHLWFMSELFCLLGSFFFIIIYCLFKFLFILCLDVNTDMTKTLRQVQPQTGRAVSTLYNVILFLLTAVFIQNQYYCLIASKTDTVVHLLVPKRVHMGVESTVVKLESCVGRV